MQAGDEAFDQLRRAIDALAESEAADVVAEARAEARGKVRSILAEALAQALLDRAQTELNPHGVPAAGPTKASGKEGPIPSAGKPSPDLPRVPMRPDPERTAGSHQAPVGPAPVGEHSPHAHAGPRSSNLGWYVYCVIGPEEIGLEGLTGTDAGHPVTVLRSDRLGAVASQVPLDEFGEDRLRERLHDVAWLEGRARSHESVLDQVRTQTTVIPMRLCTIYRTESSVHEMLERECTALIEALGRLAAKTEWGVKVFSRSDLAELVADERSPVLAQLAAEVAQASPGEAYMLRKRLEDLRGAEVDRLLEGCGEAVHAQLSAVAVDAVLNPLQPREVTNHAGEMVLNGVYLVEDSASEDLHRLVATLQDEYRDLGMELQGTGPWPPYNFVKGSVEAAR